MILLCTLNARYIHCSLGLRYLHANMGALKDQTQIMEFMINQRPIDIAENILNTGARVVGFGIYIWNISQTCELLAILKTLRPELTVILGGPEISHETESSPAFEYADYIIRGQGDFTFGILCKEILAHKKPADKIIDAAAFHPSQLTMPYDFYTDEDIRQRVIYVEASRGCPFKCEFCLSALDRTAQPFAINEFLQAMETLYQRGARHFKFVDRTFNLKIKTGKKILDFFLQKPLHDLFLHFELIPDRLPEELKTIIALFPEGSLQFEIGIQTFNPQVQHNISRKQDHEKTLQNLTYLRTQSGVHLHTDLIAGLPGENIDSFAAGFDLLVSLQPHEIQLGILKRLRGTPIIRHGDEFQMKYNPHPPYNILSTRDMDSDTLFRINRFARYWDMIANSGRFANTLPKILDDSPFNNFMQLSDWLYSTTAQTHKIALPRLFRLIYQYSQQSNSIAAELEKDFRNTGIKNPFSQVIGIAQPAKRVRRSAFSRQVQHLKSSD